MRVALAWMTAMTMVLPAGRARAIDVRSELTVGREFVFLTNDLERELLDGQLALGAGVTMVSDYRVERYGAQALIEYRGEHVVAGLEATFGPRQEARGWASLDPHVGLDYVLGRWSLHGDGGVLLRRIDAAARRASVEVDQLQLHAEIEATLAARWRVAAFGLYSFYDPDPARPTLRGLDLGLAVTLAGRPERWAAGGRLGRMLGRGVWLDLGAAGVEYADGSGTAVVPRVAVHAGVNRGVSVGASFELVVGSGSGDEALREIGGFELEYER